MQSTNQMTVTEAPLFVKREVLRQFFNQGIKPIDGRQPIPEELAQDMVQELIEFDVPKDALIGVVDSFMILTLVLQEHGFTNLVLLENTHKNLTPLQEKYYNTIEGACKKIGVKYYVPPMNNYSRCDMKFNAVIANPPYLKNLHLEFLANSLKVSDIVFLIHPSGWLFRNSVEIEKKVKKMLKGRIKKLTIFNGNTTFFGTEFACPLVKTFAVKEHNGPIEVHSEITGNTYNINDLSEFPTGYWEPTEIHIQLVKLFEELCINTSVQSLVGIKSNSHFLGCPRVVGHGKVMDSNKYAHDDFHVFHYRNSDVFNANQGDKVFNVSSKKEVEYLKSYLETKFARFGLSICKISQDLYISRYLLNVPLPPLNREWDDDLICDYYGLTAEQTDYIKSFIPT